MMQLPRITDSVYLVAKTVNVMINSAVMFDFRL